MDSFYMQEAIAEAQKAAALDEVPVGAVIVYKDKIIARAHNLRESSKNSLCHAEILAIDEASKELGGWRLFDCTLYVTLEPCPMCAGAMVQSRISRCVFGAYDAKAGSAGSVLQILNCPQLNHQVEITGGVMREECAQLLSDFFKAKRKAAKTE